MISVSKLMTVAAMPQLGCPAAVTRPGWKDESASYNAGSPLHEVHWAGDNHAFLGYCPEHSVALCRVLQIIQAECAFIPMERADIANNIVGRQSDVANDVGVTHERQKWRTVSMGPRSIDRGNG